jgi:uncharacterized membrane protein YjgN (DUF898 family)
MKNYFDFTLTGKKLLPLWILYIVAFFVPYVYLVTQMRNVPHGQHPPLYFFPIVLVLLLASLTITFFIAKLAIENIVFKGRALSFGGSFGKYIGTILLGFFLTIITIGIYLPWFMRNLHRFYVNNTSLNGNNFDFKGAGGQLFVILLLTLIVPMVVMTTILSAVMISSGNTQPAGMWIGQVVMMVLMVPYMYFVYRWSINIGFKELLIKWETNAWEACGKIAVEIFLSVVTVGIYAPLAILRLYKYFADRTVAKSTTNKHSFGYDIDQLNDFLFIWGQILLTIITLGIYHAWASCKVTTRILRKTYLHEI